MEGKSDSFINRVSRLFRRTPDIHGKEALGPVKEAIQELNTFFLGEDSDKFALEPREGAMRPRVARDRMRKIFHQEYEDERARERNSKFDGLVERIKEGREFDPMLPHDAKDLETAGYRVVPKNPPSPPQA